MSTSLALALCIAVSTQVSAKSVYDFSVTDVEGNVVSMDKYKGKLLLVVNVASQCGYTDSNYKSLEAIYGKYKKDGLEIAAFPCNQFGKQEPWEEKEIKQWVDETYSVSFDMYSKVEA